VSSAQPEEHTLSPAECFTTHTQFISAMKPIARDLEKSGAVSFSPHYLLWSW
jgi:hypothetical protein